MKPTLKRFRIMIVSGLLLSGLATASAFAADAKPNIIVISAKEFAGAKPTPTPDLDLFISKAANFTRGYATAPLAGPANAAVLTGRNPQRFGFDFIHRHKDVPFFLYYAMHLVHKPTLRTPDAS